MTICTRPGCGVDFDPATEASSSSSGSVAPCTFHPGAPVFHEGSKSWSCCRDRNKPVLEFDEFIKIPGCATEASHTAIKQPKQAFANTGAKEETGNGSASNGLDTKTSSSSPAQSSTQSIPVPLSGSRLASAQAQSAKTASSPAPEMPEEEDPLDANDETKIAKDTACKRRGCKATFDGGERSKDRAERGEQEACMYHKGVAVFHEGSKGNTCCKRRVLEFDEFLLIEGCTRAKSGHLFVGGAKTSSQANGSNANQEESVDCRIDHYETPSDVRVTVYAKGVDTDHSTVQLKDDAVELSLRMPALSTGSGLPRRCTRTIAPFAAIDPTASTYTISRFKVDLVLVKQAAGQSWPTLERGDRVFGYGLTFGRKLDA